MVIKKIDILNINKDEIEFLKESNAIEREYSDEALQDSKQAWMMAKICADEDVSIDYILAIHRRLMKRLNPRIAGNIRECDVWVGDRKCFNPEKIKLVLKDWCAGVNCPFEEIVDEAYIKQSHIRFEEIHPFEDGNGRIGRILMNIQRLKIGLPVLIIHEGKEQMEYYKWFKDID